MNTITIHLIIMITRKTSSCIFKILQIPIWIEFIFSNLNDYMYIMLQELFKYTSTLWIPIIATLPIYRVNRDINHNRRRYCGNRLGHFVPRFILSASLTLVISLQCPFNASRELPGCEIKRHNWIIFESTPSQVRIELVMACFF